MEEASEHMEAPYPPEAQWEAEHCASAVLLSEDSLCATSQVTTSAVWLVETGASWALLQKANDSRLLLLAPPALRDTV